MLEDPIIALHPDRAQHEQEEGPNRRPELGGPGVHHAWPPLQQLGRRPRRRDAPTHTAKNLEPNDARVGALEKEMFDSFLFL